MDTKQKILDVATRLLKQRGYHGWSYEQISKEVGITKASIHYYFPTKENLVACALKLYVDAFFADLEILNERILSAKEKIIDITERYRKVCESPDEWCLCTILSADHMTLSLEVRDGLARFYRRLESFISSVIRAGIESGELKNTHLDVEGFAHLFINTLQGLLVTSKYSSDATAFNRSIKVLLSFL